MREKSQTKKSISSKKDIIDMITGSKIYTEPSTVLEIDEYVQTGIIKTSGSEPTNFEEGDTITINGDLYTFSYTPEQIDNGLLLGEDLNETCFDNESEDGILATIYDYTKQNDDIPNILINSSNNLSYVLPYGKTYLQINYSSYVDGDTLTIGNIEYTFKDEPTEENDIPVYVDSNSPIITKLNSNPDIIGTTLISIVQNSNIVFLLSAPDITIVDSGYHAEVRHIPPLITIDVRKPVHIFFPPNDNYTIRMPRFGIPGIVLKLVNISNENYSVIIHSSINGYGNPGEPYFFQAGTTCEAIYVNEDVGWLRFSYYDGPMYQMFSGIS